MSPRDLPVWELHAEILRHLTDGNQLVVVAATGSGKTTQVPQMLLDAGLAGDRKIVVLQPRRVAARTVAARVAWERRGQLGAEVGYQVRFDDRTGLGTRICFVTEGILLRWLQDDRELRDVGVVVFDEFHERNLLSDVALALVKQLQQTRRPELKIVVMSATLEAEPVAQYLANLNAERGRRNAESPSANPEPGTLNPELRSPDPAPETRNSKLETCPSAPILVSEGRVFPVEIRWAEYGDRRPASEQAGDAVERIVRQGESGDILVFMPGMGEINSTINALRAADLGEAVSLIPLHGDLPPEDQDRAFQPSERRKIVVATNVAETSVTIDGIRHVVDSGVARMARYDPERGLQTLHIEEISRASADQRMGRAGRTAPGTCWRLWTESGHLNRPPRNTPEIQRADLAETVLLLHSLGIRQAAGFDWLDRPDPAAVERAERLLVTLGALRGARGEGRGAKGSVAVPSLAARSSQLAAPSDLTPIGHQMLRLPMHPRFSRMLVEAGRRDCIPGAAQCAALVSGRDLLMRVGREDRHLAEARELFEGSALSDFYTLMRAQQFAKRCQFSVEQCRRHGIHAQTARQIEDTFRQLLNLAEQHLRPSRDELADVAEAHDPDAEEHEAAESAAVDAGDEPLLKCILAGFADQLAIRRDTGTLDCELTEGRQGTLMRESVVQESPLFVVASIREVSGRTGHLTLLGLATAIKREWLEELFPQHFSATVEHLYDRTHRRVAAVKLIRFLDLVIAHEHQSETDPAAAGRCLAEAATRGWIELPKFGHEARQFQARVNCLHRALPQLEIPPLDAPALTRCLAKAFHGLTLAKEAQAVSVDAAVRSHLPPGQLPWLDELAPAWISWPDGRRVKVTYPESPDDPEALPEVQVKLTDCFALKEHPCIGEGKIPLRLGLQTPDSKRLEATTNWPAWRERNYPKLRAALKAKFPAVLWP